MPNRLKKLAIDFVSLVDRPANQPAHIVLTKRDAAPVQEPPKQEPTTVSHSAAATADKPAEQPVALTKADMDAAIDAAIKKAAEESAVTIAKLTTDLETANTRAQTAENVAKAEQEARETTESIAKAERDYPALPGTTPVEIAPILRKVARALTAEEYAKLDEVLKAASVAVSKSSVYRETGATGGPNGASGQTAEAQIQAAADELRKGDPKLTPAAAIVKAMDSRPDLVEKDRIEKGFRKAN